MWVFSEMYKKDLFIRTSSFTLLPPWIQLPISNFEVAMDADNYKELTEATNTYKYQLANEKNTYFLLGRQLLGISRLLRR